MEPLVILRDCVSMGKSIKFDDSSLILDGRRFPKATPTAFISTTKQPYTVWALYVQWLYRDLPFGEYSNKCKAEGAQRLVATDREAVNAYLRRENDAEGRLDASVAAAAAGSAEPSEPAATQAAKRQRVDVDATVVSEERALFGSLLDRSDELFGFGHLLGQEYKQSECLSRETFGRLQSLFKAEAPVFKSIVDREVVVLNRFNALDAPNKKLAQDVLEVLKEAAAPKEAAVPAVRGTPIIIVPAVATAFLNLFNAKAFLEAGTYVPPDVARASANGHKDNKITIEHLDSRGVKCRYYVMDSVDLLAPTDWEKVVAVFVLGPAWQFKGWKWQSPVDCLAHVLGFNLRSDLDLPHENISKWKVTPLVLNKTRPLSARVCATDFWRKIDEFIAVRKPHLRQRAENEPVATHG